MFTWNIKTIQTVFKGGISSGFGALISSRTYFIKIRLTSSLGARIYSGVDTKTATATRDDHAYK